MRKIEVFNDSERVEMVEEPFFESRERGTVPVTFFDFGEQIVLFQKLNDCRMQERCFLPDKPGILLKERLPQVEQFF